VVPVAAPYYDYADEVQKAVHDAGFYVDVDTSGETLNKKIRNGQLANYNFILGMLSTILGTAGGRGTNISCPLVLRNADIFILVNCAYETPDS
jgi:hypothetical protein